MVIFQIAMSSFYCVRLFVEIAPDLESCQKMMKTAPGVTLFHPYNGKGWATTVSLNPYFLSAVSTLKGEYSLSAKEGFHKSCISIVNECHCNMSRKEASSYQGVFSGVSTKSKPLIFDGVIKPPPRSQCVVTSALFSCEVVFLLDCFQGEYKQSRQEK